MKKFLLIVLTFVLMASISGCVVYVKEEKVDSKKDIASSGNNLSISSLEANQNQKPTNIISEEEVKQIIFKKAGVESSNV